MISISVGLFISFPYIRFFLKSLPIETMGLRLADKEVRMAVGLTLCLALCKPHLCQWRAGVNARGPHGLACEERRQAPQARTVERC